MRGDKNHYADRMLDTTDYVTELRSVHLIIQSSGHNLDTRWPAIRFYIS
jgi:hypothetical protein